MGPREEFGRADLASERKVEDDVPDTGPLPQDPSEQIHLLLHVHVVTAHRLYSARQIHDPVRDANVHEARVKRPTRDLFPDLLRRFLVFRSWHARIIAGVRGYFFRFV